MSVSHQEEAQSIEKVMDYHGWVSF
uniref:Uncharacterized protein n=1 Tax=Anguilla anguilla TaxID=7936 RepID=A0A0E9QCE7_ANGAN